MEYVLVARSKDYERLSIQSLKSEFKKDSNNRSDGEYMPSKEYIRNKKQYVIKEEKLKNRKKDFTTSKIRTKYSVNKFIKSLEKEIFKNNY